jgi:hypothetical protein
MLDAGRGGCESADGKGGRHKSAALDQSQKPRETDQFDPGFVIRLNQFLKQSSPAMEPLGREKRCQITAASLATINIRPPRSQHPLLPFSPAASQPPLVHSSTFHPQSNYLPGFNNLFQSSIHSRLLSQDFISPHPT